MSGRVQRDVSSAFGAVLVDVSAADQALPAGCRGLYIGTTGDVKIDMPSATGIVFSDVPVGILTVQATNIYNSGTTASDIVALY